MSKACQFALGITGDKSGLEWALEVKSEEQQMALNEQILGVFPIFCFQKTILIKICVDYNLYCVYY